MQSFTRVGLLMLALVATVVGAVLTTPDTIAAKEDADYVIRFAIIYHANQGHKAPYLAAAKKFAEQVEQRTNGHVKVKVFDAGAANNLNTKIAGNLAALDDVAAGRIEMCDIYGDYVGHKFDKRFQVFNLPYLFRDYEHARKVVEGPIGQKMLDGLKSHNVVGLAFTYSGGFRIVASKRPITKMEDLSGLKTNVMRSPILAANFTAWNAVPVVSKRGDTLALAEQGAVDAAEGTYNYYDCSQPLQQKMPVLNELGHNFFVTVMVANSQFLDRLPPLYRAIVVRTAREAGKFERERTIDDNAQIRKQAIAKGQKVVTMSAAERQRLAHASAGVYQQFSKMVSADLVNEIRSIK